MQPDPSTAKDWVKNPGGAIRRKDRIGVSSVGSLRLVGVSVSLVMLPTCSRVAHANGRERQLLGSAGRLSRPAAVTLLTFPPAKAAQCCVRNEVVISGFCESDMILLAGDVRSQVPTA